MTPQLFSFQRTGYSELETQNLIITNFQLPGNNNFQQPPNNNGTQQHTNSANKLVTELNSSMNSALFDTNKSTIRHQQIRTRYTINHLMKNFRNNHIKMVKLTCSIKTIEEMSDSINLKT